MEVMRAFKAGDKVKVTASNKVLRKHLCNPKIKFGSIHTVTSVTLLGSFVLDNLDSRFVKPDFIKLAYPKWSIYNNDLPWKKLSNKQKGKLLLAAYDGVKFFDFDNITPSFLVYSQVYTAIKPEPVKPEPTMAALFVVDWNDCMGDFGDSAIQMIAKGWNKPCK